MKDYLNQKERNAIDRFSEGLRKSLAHNLVNMVLFGSKVKGNHTEDSDIDLLIVVKEKTPLVRQKVYDILFDIDPFYELKISILIYSEVEYRKNEELKSTFLENLEREGVRL